jgi:hypothetical protein
MLPLRLVAVLVLLTPAAINALDDARGSFASQSSGPLTVQNQAVEVTNASGKSIRISEALLKQLARRKIEAKDSKGKTTVYEGVVLATLLEKAGIKLDKELRGPRLANYLLVEAKDGYRVVFALPEVDPTMSDNLILFADTKDGKALDDNEGPFRIVVPHEKHQSRWVRQVTRISEQSALPPK